MRIDNVDNKEGIKQYVVLVDGFRNGMVFRLPKDRLYERNTAGRYRTAARSEKEAEQFVRDAVGFGSVKVYYEDKNGNTLLPYGVVKEEVFGALLNPHHATDKLGKKGDIIVHLSNIDELKEFFLLVGKENICHPYIGQKHEEGRCCQAGYMYALVERDNPSCIQMFDFKNVYKRNLITECDNYTFSYFKNELKYENVFKKDVAKTDIELD